MKRFVSCLLAVIMVCSLLAGCAAPGKDSTAGETAAAAGIFYELTGIPENQTVMTVSGVDITAQQYLYWLAYLCTSMEYNITSYNAYYGVYGNLVNQDDSTVLWNNEFEDGKTLAQYVRDETESTLRFYTAIDQMAQKYKAGLDAEDEAAMAQKLSDAISEMGGQDAFDTYLKKLGISQDTFQELSASGYLFDNLLKLVLEQGTDLYLTPEKYDNYATFADHILLTTIDTTSGEPLPAKEIQKKKALADDLLAQLQNAKPEELETLFTKLADEYSEDTGRKENPDGYIFSPGTMVQIFEDTAKSLQVGQISDIVESDYGYHIILRKDLAAALESNPEKKVELAQKHLTTLLTILSQEATVTTTPEIEELDIAQFYPAYAAKVKELTIANADAMGEEMRAAQAAETTETTETAATEESK